MTPIDTSHATVVADQITACRTRLRRSLQDRLNLQNEFKSLGGYFQIHVLSALVFSASAPGAFSHHQNSLLFLAHSVISGLWLAYGFRRAHAAWQNRKKFRMCDSDVDIWRWQYRDAMLSGISTSLHLLESPDLLSTDNYAAMIKTVRENIHDTGWQVSNW